jgi:hypothetical protein
MEVLGYEVTPKMLAIGGAGVAGLMYLVSRGQSGDTGAQTINLVPSGDLGWETIRDGDPSGRLIGGPGPAGEPGPAGAPGEPGVPGTPGTPGTGTGTGVDQDDDKRRRRRRDRDKNDRGNGGGRRDRDDRGNGGGRRDRDRDQIREPDRPNQGNRQNPPKVDDPRLDDPKRARRREEGRGGLRNDRRNDDTSENTGNGGRIDIDVSGGRERDKGKRARAKADGGRANVGNVGPNTRGKIDASGGKAKADASGGNGNRTGQAAKQAAKKVLGKRKGGDAFAGDDPDYGGCRQRGRYPLGTGEAP